MQRTMTLADRGRISCTTTALLLVSQPLSVGGGKAGVRVRGGKAGGEG